MNIIKVFFVIAAILSGVMAVFQFLLSLGLPFGKLAWGGESARLSNKLRISSLISSLIMIFAMVILLEKADLLSIIGNDTVITISMWIFVAIFGLSTLGNIASKSKLEKTIMTPIAAYLVIAFLLAIIR